MKIDEVIADASEKFEFWLAEHSNEEEWEYHIEVEIQCIIEKAIPTDARELLQFLLEDVSLAITEVKERSNVFPLTVCEVINELVYERIEEALMRMWRKARVDGKIK